MSGVDIAIADGVSIREWREEDAESLGKYANNRNIWRNLRDLFPYPYTIGDAHDWIAKNMVTSPAANLAIATPTEAIGAVGLVAGTDVASRSGEIGYWVGEPFWGHGTATAALRAFVEYVFDTFDLVRLHACVYEWNPASARVLEKAGFTHEARLKSAVFKDGQIIDVLIYAMVRG